IYAQRRDIGLRRVDERRAVAIRRDAKDDAFIARPDEQSPLLIEGERPDIFRLRLEEDLCVALRRDAINLAVRRGARIYIALRVYGERHDIQFASLVKQRPLARCVYFEDAPFVPGA